MNERIKELALQAGFGEQWFEEHPTGCSLPKPLMLKEYTELIVKESMKVTKDYTCNQGWDYSAPVALARHFGVEE